MSVTVTQTGAHRAEITWTRDDDPRGHLARAVESGQLEDALTALGATTVEDLGAPEQLRRIASSTAHLQKALERRMRALAVALRAEGLSWAELADTLYGDPNMRSTARAARDAGLRQMGLPATADQD